MHNCLILGCGRSGTSMVAGTLAGAGYFMGERLLSSNRSNPKGFFEDTGIHAVNERILAPATPWVPPRFRPGRVRLWLHRAFFRHKPGDGQRWLARVPLGASLGSSPKIDACIRALTSRAPYCFKDPRFCYTLPVWRRWLGDTRFVCVFRDPTVSAASMVREVATAPYLANLKLDYDDCLDVWRSMYGHVLEIHCIEGQWLFLHYNQVLDGTGLDALARFLGASPDRSFPDPALRRTKPRGPVPEPVRAIYEELCRRAGKVESKAEP